MRQGKINEFARKAIVIAIAGVFSIHPLCAYSQESTGGKEEEMVERANKILNRSRQAVYKGIDTADVHGLTLKSITNRFIKPSNGNGKNGEISKEIVEESIHLRFPDLLLVSRTEYKEGALKERNSTTIVSKVNGAQSSTKFDFVSNGVTAADLLASNRVPPSIKRQMRESFNGISQVSKSEIQRSLWMRLFPMLLRSPWKSDEVFAYIGKAESDEIRADILELISEKTKRIRFFFNEETHLLLMTTIEEKNEESISKTTNYYSDYEEMAGILIARKIVSDSEVSILVETEFLGQKIYPRTTTRIKERIVLGFSVNPPFGANMFEVRGRKL